MNQYRIQFLPGILDNKQIHRIQSLGTFQHSIELQLYSSHGHICVFQYCFHWIQITFWRSDITLIVRARASIGSRGACSVASLSSAKTWRSKWWGFKSFFFFHFRERTSILTSHISFARTYDTGKDLETLMISTPCILAGKHCCETLTYSFLLFSFWQENDASSWIGIIYTRDVYKMLTMWDTETPNQKKIAFDLSLRNCIVLTLHSRNSNKKLKCACEDTNHDTYRKYQCSSTIHSRDLNHNLRRF